MLYLAPQLMLSFPNSVFLTTIYQMLYLCSREGTITQPSITRVFCTRCSQFESGFAPQTIILYNFLGFTHLIQCWDVWILRLNFEVLSQQCI